MFGNKHESQKIRNVCKPPLKYGKCAFRITPHRPSRFCPCHSGKSQYNFSTIQRNETALWTFSLAFSDCLEKAKAAVQIFFEITLLVFLHADQSSVTAAMCIQYVLTKSPLNWLLVIFVISCEYNP